MLLREMFSPIGAPKEPENDVDWLDDLKFFIDNNNDLLDGHFFPAIKKQKEHKDHPHVYKVYIKPIEISLGHYCKQFNVEHPEEKFPKEKLIDLAKRIATEQAQYIKRGDYES